MTITVDNVNDLRENVIIIGKVNSNPRLSEFNNIRGELSKSLKCKSQTKPIPVLCVSLSGMLMNRKIPKVFNVGINVRLIGTRIKPGNPAIWQWRF